MSEVEIVSINSHEGLDKELSSELGNLYAKHRPNVLKLMIDDITTKSSEKKVDVSSDPHRFIIDRNQPFFVTMTSVTFFIPFEGHRDLFYCRPSTFSLSPPRAKIDKSELILTYLLDGDIVVHDVKDQFEKDLKSIQLGVDRINNDISNSLGNDILENAKKLIKVRINKNQESKELVKELGYKKKRSKQKPRKIDIVPLKSEIEYDFFISHASEDKNIANELFRGLTGKGYKVWLDSIEIKLGDKLTSKVDEGLLRSKSGIVLLSPNFFKKKWTDYELQSLTAKDIESDGGRIILPIICDMTWDDVRVHSIMLANTKGLEYRDGIDKIINEIHSNYQN